MILMAGSNVGPRRSGYVCWESDWGLNWTSFCVVLRATDGCLTAVECLALAVFEQDFFQGCPEKYRVNARVNELNGPTDYLSSAAGLGTR